MKIIHLILALSLAFSGTSFAVSDSGTADKKEKKSIGYVSSSIKWCGENKGRFAAYATAAVVLTSVVGYMIYSASGGEGTYPLDEFLYRRGTKANNHPVYGLHSLEISDENKVEFVHGELADAVADLYGVDNVGDRFPYNQIDYSLNAFTEALQDQAKTMPK